jgi:hypothetical protein
VARVVPAAVSSPGDATITLDQKFDLETVEAQARVVLEELYLDKYDPDKTAQLKFDRELLGPFHPYAKDTMEEEIARCKMPPAKPAAQLRDFAGSVRLPANIDQRRNRLHWRSVWVLMFQG